MALISKRKMIDLGDSGTLNVRPVPGGVCFTIMEGTTGCASVVLSADKATWIAECIGLCLKPVSKHHVLRAK